MAYASYLRNYLLGIPVMFGAMMAMDYFKEGPLLKRGTWQAEQRVQYALATALVWPLIIPMFTGMVGVTIGVKMADPLSQAAVRVLTKFTS